VCLIGDKENILTLIICELRDMRESKNEIYQTPLTLLKIGTKVKNSKSMIRGSPMLIGTMTYTIC
jgi:hypothetical protein